MYLINLLINILDVLVVILVFFLEEMVLLKILLFVDFLYLGVFVDV